MYDVRGSGRGWTVTCNGVPIGPTRDNPLQAYALADRLERARRIQERRCITCHRPFQSEGPHNRMCNCCREHAVEGMI